MIIIKIGELIGNEPAISVWFGWFQKKEKKKKVLP